MGASWQGWRQVARWQLLTQAHVRMGMRMADMGGRERMQALKQACGQLSLGWAGTAPGWAAAAYTCRARTGA